MSHLKKNILIIDHISHVQPSNCWNLCPGRSPDGGALFCNWGTESENLSERACKDVFQLSVFLFVFIVALEERIKELNSNLYIPKNYFNKSNLSELATGC